MTDIRNNANKIALAISLLVLLNLAFYYAYFTRNHHLPPPFLMDANDTFMDFYNPLYWALNDGFYNTYKSIYPALNYFILKLFGIGILDINNYQSPFALRHAYPELALVIMTVYVVIILCIINVGEWKKVNYINKWILFFTCIFSAPILFAYERGNLIFIALLFLALYLNSLNEWLRAFYMALLLNIKPYFIIFLLQYLNKGGYGKRELLKIILLFGIIFFILGWLANVNFISFFQNYLLTGQKGWISAYGLISLPHSLSSLSSIKHFLIFENSSYNFWFSLLKVLNYIPLLILLYYSFFKKLSKTELLIICFFLVCTFSAATGGYILIIYLLLIPYLLNSSEYKILLFPIIGIYALPIDWFSIISVPVASTKSYLGDQVLGDKLFYIGLGSVIRPILNYLAVIIFTVYLVGKYSPRYFKFNK